jgi:hypothetical protein
MVGKIADHAKKRVDAPGRNPVDTTRVFLATKLRDPCDPYIKKEY